MSYETLVHELEQTQHDYELAVNEISQLKQKLDSIRTVIVDVFDKDTIVGDADIYLDVLIRIERAVRGVDYEA